MMAHRATDGHVHLSARWVRITLSPSPPLRTVRRVFPNTAPRLACQTRLFHPLGRLSDLPASPTSACDSPFVFRTRIRGVVIPLNVGATLRAMHRHSRGLCPLCPRGPRSGPGYSVPVHHRLPSPIRPTRRHIEISPQGGLYPTPSLSGSASAAHEWIRTFPRVPSGHVAPASPGKFDGCMRPVFAIDTGLHP